VEADGFGNALFSVCAHIHGCWIDTWLERDCAGEWAFCIIEIDWPDRAFDREIPPWWIECAHHLDIWRE
jgi:hypothetical protein